MKVLGMTFRMMFVVLGFVLASQSAHSGVDLAGTIARMQIKDDRLWLKINESKLDTYCKPGWHGFNLYIDSREEMFPYYYGLLLNAFNQKQRVFFANIDYFDGSGPCDFTKTGYGMVVLSN